VIASNHKTLAHLKHLILYRDSANGVLSLCGARPAGQPMPRSREAAAPRRPVVILVIYGITGATHPLLPRQVDQSTLDTTSCCHSALN
jgi:hypothetical protein